jgi:SAM-dependent methyltransferase
MIVRRVREVLRDRKARMRMSEAEYWDERVRSREGHARSVWHSQAFSEVWNERQARLLSVAFEDLLGGMSGRDVLDLGCGTGRITRWLARGGAKAVGVDFSEAAIEAARQDAEREALPGSYVVGDVARPPLPFGDGAFDAVVSVGCLAVACTDLASLERAFAEMRRLARPRGIVVALEPVHSSRLLGRVLRAPWRAWVGAAQRAGLRLARRRGMGFVPLRLALSSFDLPPWLVSPAFWAGEATLDVTRLVWRLADYSLLCFRPAPNGS